MLISLSDIVDYFEPIMLIVGSRGLSHLKGLVCAFLYIASVLIAVPYDQHFARFNIALSHSEMLRSRHGRPSAA